MSIADILLRVVPSATDELSRLAVAVDLAQRLTARLDGVFVVVDPRSRRESSWAKTLFERAVSRTSLETTWRVVDGRSTAPLLFQARRADLAILPPSALVAGPECERPELVALQSGGPTLVLPHPRNAMSIGHTILVGWEETREAARALHDALPILESADSVYLLTVTKEEEPEPLGGRHLLDHLRQHGVPVEFVGRHGDPGEEIAATARDIEADMLVLGLTSRDAASGVHLGDASSRFIRSMAFPIFFSC